MVDHFCFDEGMSESVCVCAAFTCVYRFRRSQSHSNDAAFFSHDVSGVDFYGASGPNDLSKNTDEAGINYTSEKGLWSSLPPVSNQENRASVEI